MVLDVISSIYSADAANYFILEQQCTLGQLAQVIHTKEKPVQVILCPFIQTNHFAKVCKKSFVI